MSAEDCQISPAAAAAFQEAERLEGNVLVWTVSTGTKDYGQLYVARPNKVILGGGGPLAVYLVADTLSELREMLPPGLTRLSRVHNDASVIVEVWL